jgi:hypothetical protein
MITSNARAEFTTKTTSLFGPIRWRDLRCQFSLNRRLRVCGVRSIPWVRGGPLARIIVDILGKFSVNRRRTRESLA